MKITKKYCLYQNSYQPILIFSKRCQIRVLLKNQTKLKNQEKLGKSGQEGTLYANIVFCSTNVKKKDKSKTLFGD